MSIFTTKRTLLMICISVAVVLSSPAYAIFGKLSTSLVGTSINGVTTSGKASVNQANYPVIPGLLMVNISKVNLPNGTVVSVSMSDCPWFGPVAYMNVVDGSASISTSLPSVCQTGRASSITINDQGGNVLLRGGSPWKI
jgi:hypothetical protein